MIKLTKLSGSRLLFFVTILVILSCNEEKDIEPRVYFLDDLLTQLDEVVVTTKSYMQEEIDSRTPYSEPSNRLILDSLATQDLGQSIFELVRVVPGVTVLGTFPNQSVRINGNASISNNTATYFLDGMLVDIETIQTLPLDLVEFIDVLKGFIAAIYGLTSAGGAVLINTKRGGSSYQLDRSTGLLAFVHPGYHQAKDFYSPTMVLRRKNI